MATNKDTENNTPSAPTPADNDIAKLTEVTEQDLAEAIEDEYGAKYSKEGKRLLKAPKDFSHYNIKEGTEIICKNDTVSLSVSERSFKKRDPSLWTSPEKFVVLGDQT